MSTPIEVLFHHSPNCSCEQCQKTVKPYRNGKFLSKEELEQINNDIQSLVQENQKLQAMLEKLAEEKLQLQKVLVAKQEPPQPPQEESVKEAVADPAPPRQLTLTIDTSNLLYIIVIGVLLIMVMRK